MWYPVKNITLPKSKTQDCNAPVLLMRDGAVQIVDTVCRKILQQARVHNKLWFMNSHKGFLRDVANNILIMTDRQKGL